MQAICRRCSTVVEQKVRARFEMIDYLEAAGWIVYLHPEVVCICPSCKDSKP